MIITRHNYEEYFLLYVDNELSVQERRMVDAFVRENADLEEELNMIRQSVLRPDKSVVFQNKGQLMKKSSGMAPINELNYAEYFVLYGDDELSTEENDMVEQFVYRNPQFQVEFELIQQARFTPDTSIVFPDKESLYRKEKTERKVIYMSWWRMAAAAVVLLFAGAMGWNYFFSGKDNGNGQSPEVVVKKTDTPSTEITDETKTTTTDPGTTVPYVATTDKVENTATSKNAVKKTSVPGRKRIEEKVPEDNYIGHTEPKFKNSSNIGSNTIVTPIENVEGQTVAAMKPPVIAEERDLGKLSEKLDENDNLQANFALNTNNELEVLNTSINKNTSRGFFRKIGRVVGKVTNIGPKADKETNDDNKGIRIANFEIALN